MAPPSATVNVARYSALTFGIAYGFFHRRTLQKEQDKRKVVVEHQKREQWVAQAKQAWQKKVLAQSSGSGVISDPENPAFDLEAYLNKVAAGP